MFPGSNHKEKSLNGHKFYVKQELLKGDNFSGLRTVPPLISEICSLLRSQLTKKIQRN